MQEFNEWTQPEKSNLMQNRKMRATWVSSVINLGWPSVSSLTIKGDAARVKRRREELTCILENIVEMEMNINLLIFKVFIRADALYTSGLLPWLKCLRGTLGKNPGF